MTRLRLIVITRNQKNKDKAQKLSELILSTLSIDSLSQIDKYPKFDDSFKITIVFTCNPTNNLIHQMIEIADKLLSPWITFYDRTTNSVNLIYNKTDFTQKRRNEFDVVEWAELKIDE
ncbi:conserved hypothetical protein [Flavobacterium sp. 9AF]|uniref:hypothetical protein n=1 Tax=Flavobacterium sp. 9AF TaxID=2653142 RepID=UPI0012EF1A26|nr:hypothetical protein [Flavobacterium sp. 9AF]VXB49615.1 conserved hypothetical protein [Flavobacterium sp. 9AF]